MHKHAKIPSILRTQILFANIAQYFTYFNQCMNMRYRIDTAIHFVSVCPLSTNEYNFKDLSTIYDLVLVKNKQAESTRPPELRLTHINNKVTPVFVWL